MSKRVRRYIFAGSIIVVILFGMVVLAYTSLPVTLSGVSQLESATNHITSNPSEASQQYAQASDTIQNALASIRNSGPLALFAPLPPFRWVVHFDKAAGYLANAGNAASSALATYPSLPTGEVSDINALLSTGSSQFFQWFAAHPDDFNTVKTNLAAADAELSAIPSWIFLTKQAEFEKLANNVHAAHLAIPKAEALISALQEATGSKDSNPHTFLVVFQNNAELRPTGGFLGSYGTLTASSGTIRTFTFGTDIYKLDKPYAATTKISPPDPLKTITNYWGFRDSTIGSGFLADGAQNIQKFYTAESGQKIDGVIFVDSTVLEDILRITGSITLPDGTAAINATSVNQVLTTDIEQTYYQNPENKATAEPKSVLNQLIPLLIGKLEETPGGFRSLVTDLRTETTRKSIQFWFADATTEQAAVAVQPFDSPQSGNWLKVVNTNIGGLKSSTSVSQAVKITQQESATSNLLTQTIDISRKHTGTGAWPDGTNNNYMEVYLPPSAKVTLLPIGQGGKSQLPLDQQQALGTSYGQIVQPHVDTTASWVRVGFWASTPVGGTTTYTLSYTLPLSQVGDTTITYIKEAGEENETLQAFSYNGAVNENLTLRRE